MPIDIFNVQQFEAALPKHKITGNRLWEYAGMIDGERVYLLPVKHTPNITVDIMIRSSIGRNGLSADCGQDSIRALVVGNTRVYKDCNGQSRIEFTPLGSKTCKWVTRLPGWERRLHHMLRKLYMLGTWIRDCPKCGATMHLCRIRRGDSAGMFAVACKRECDEFHVILGSDK